MPDLSTWSYHDLGDHGVLKSGKGKGFSKSKYIIHHLTTKAGLFTDLCFCIPSPNKKKKRGIAGAVNSVINPFSGREKTLFFIMPDLSGLFYYDLRKS